MHAGIDIAVGYGTPIHASAGGTVIFAGWMGGYGNFVIIDHGGGLSTGYAHQSSIAVGGGSVAQGQVIGYVGCTGHCFGPHLHFEVRVNGSSGRSARLPLGALDVGAEALPPARCVAEGRAQARLDERDPCWLESGVGSGAAPRPVERVLDEVRLDGIAGEVAAGVDEVFVAFDLTRERVGAKEMSLAAVAAVVVARVLGVELLERS